jgi:hypothetical protein
VPLDMGGKGRPHPSVNDRLSRLWPDRSDGGCDRSDRCTPGSSEDDQTKSSRDWKLET